VAACRTGAGDSELAADRGGAREAPKWKACRPISRRELIRSRIVQDGTARARLCVNSGGAKFAAHLNSYSQPSAKLVVLLPETGNSLYAAFFKNNSVPHG
jgi:hypothetical protein